MDVIVDKIGRVCEPFNQFEELSGFDGFCLGSSVGTAGVLL